MEDVELFGQTVTAVTQGPKRQRRQAPSDVESKPVSTFFSELSSFAGRITGIPVIGAYAGTVAWASAALSGAASAFGWSKPIETSALSRVYHNPAQVYGNAWVSGNAWVYGNAWVSDNAWVSGNAQVYVKRTAHSRI